MPQGVEKGSFLIPWQTLNLQLTKKVAMIFAAHTAPARVELYSGVLSLGVGDTVACVAGKAWGRNHWPGNFPILLSVIYQFCFVEKGTMFFRHPVPL